MPRFRRVNIDGISITETRKVAAALLPGTFVAINEDDEFEQATTNAGRLYVLNPATSEGLDILTAVPEGHSAVADYVEESREFAVRMGAGTYVKDQPVTVGAGGLAVALSGSGTFAVLGYIQEDATLTEADFVRIRVRAGSVTVA